jgi:hypothetical protein
MLNIERFTSPLDFEEDNDGLEKTFNPDELRDDHGRWTESGGSFPKVAVDTLKGLKEKYPELKDTELNWTDLGNNGVFAHAGGGNIYLNSYYFHNEEGRKEGSTGSNVLADNSFRGIITHEAGHALGQIIDKKLGIEKTSEIAKEVYGTDRADLKDLNPALAPSAMAQENVWELRAESFSTLQSGKTGWGFEGSRPSQHEKSLAAAREYWSKMLDAYHNYTPTRKTSMLKATRVYPTTKPWRDLDDPAVQQIQQIVERALANCRDAVIKHLSEHMAKASPEEEAQSLIADLHLEDELTAIVEIAPLLQDIGTQGGQDAVHAAIQSAGLPNGAESDIWTIVDDRMVAYAKARAAELIGMRYDADGNLIPAKRAEYRIDETTRTMLNNSLSSALSAGLTSGEIQRGLMEDYAFSPARALTIARTESAFAHSRGAMNGYRETSNHFKMKMEKLWSIAEEACDECIENNDAGWIPLDDTFPSGDDASPAHPNCRCDILTRFVNEGGGP